MAKISYLRLGERSLLKEGALNSKGLKQEEKRKKLEELHPEWFI